MRPPTHCEPAPLSAHRGDPSIPIWDSLHGPELEREKRGAYPSYQMAAEPLPRAPGALHPQMPGMFVDADRRSLAGQRWALSLRGTQLVLLVAAALLAVLPFTARGIEWGVLGAGVAFAAAFLTEATILSIQPEKTWYQCRAIAESVKSLAWRYAVGGNPFPTPSTEPGQADLLFANHLHQLLVEFGTSGLVPSKGSAKEITHWMQETRTSGFPSRKETYRRRRIDNQRDWYADKAQWNQRRSTEWSIGLLAVQILAVAGAVLKGTGVIQFDALGVLAAVAASAVAWLQIKQHSTLTQSYAQAANELSEITIRLDEASEATWAKFVDDAESAISREHTAWLIKRT